MNSACCKLSVKQKNRKNSLALYDHSKHKITVTHGERNLNPVRPPFCDPKILFK